MPRNFKRRSSKKPLNRRLRGGRSKPMKGGFGAIQATNSYYHPKVPRTLQIATRRYKKQMLRFVVNQTYKCTPQGAGSVGPENCYLQFRANSIHDVMNGALGNGSLMQPNTWASQHVQEYGPTVTNVTAEGYDNWKERFQHFTVLGSRLQATCQTIVGTSASETGTFYVNLAGATGSITNTKQAWQIMELPYTKRARLFPAVTTAGGATANVPGARLQINYSAKKFEGVNDVMDNSNLRGAFDNSFGEGKYPTEQSFYTVGM